MIREAQIDSNIYFENPTDPHHHQRSACHDVKIYDTVTVNTKIDIIFLICFL